MASSAINRLKAANEKFRIDRLVILAINACFYQRRLTLILG